MRQNGYSFNAIARLLNGDGVPTARGGREWYAQTVKQIVLQKPEPV
jgi:hypothetical protein